jgi:DedD protein
MDRQLLERMIGAGVLLVALVLIAPAILDGRRDSGIASYSENGTGGTGPDLIVPGLAVPAPRMRTHTIVLDREPDGPPVARAVTEPSAVAEPQAITPQPEATPAPDKPPAAAAAADKAPVDEALTDKAAADRVVADKVVADRAAVEPAPAGSPASGWSVQLGSFAERPNAERLASEVGSQGFTAYLEPMKKSGRTFYRVRVGPRDTRDQATELASGLAKVGYSGQVIQQQAAP